MRSFEGQRKQELRRAAVARRASLCRAQVCSWGERIQDRVLQHPRYRASGVVALYSPIGNEVPTHRIRDRAFAEGREVLYPKTGKRAGGFALIASCRDLVPGRGGLLEPRGEHWASAGWDGLVVFVPAVLVDPAGNRIGRGGGWYDRALAALAERATRIALVYECQLIEEVPAEKWDRPMDFIITEERVLQCGAKR